MSWRPNISRNNLLKRSLIIQKIRSFFYERGLLEVETPIISSSAVTDEHLTSFKTTYNGKTYYLNTSPEYLMKRLLASGSGSIFQICKVFRDEEISNKHNPEFTMLEWYRPGLNLERLLDEVEDLFKIIFDFEILERYSYSFIFEQKFDISPLTISNDKLIDLSSINGLIDANKLDRDSLLNFLFSTQIEPELGKNNPVAIYDYPASQAALAKLNPCNPLLAQRVEVFYKGIELANGFYELTDYQLQKDRFIDENRKRLSKGLDVIKIDDRFLEALKHGLPEGSGIAVGLDRLIMLALNKNNIKDVITFDINNS